MTFFLDPMITTVLNLQNFSVTQNLCEIKIDETIIFSSSTILTHLKANYLNHWERSRTVLVNIQMANSKSAGVVQKCVPSKLQIKHILICLLEPKWALF